MSARQDSHDISDNLKDWRSRHELLQTETAELLRVPYDTYRGWEAGRNCPRASHVLALLRAISPAAIRKITKHRLANTS